MSGKPETGEKGLQSFVDWVNADSPEIPPEIVYEPKAHHHEHHEEHEHQPDEKELIRREYQKSSRLYRGVSLACGLLMALVLLFTISALPKFGSAESPAWNEVSRRYLEQGLSETGAVNVVAGMILDYRAFDTLGESMVLFTASIAVIFLLSQQQEEKKQKKGEKKKEQKVARADSVDSLPAKVIIRMVFPVILLYGIYVVINGHLSPGGGFSGGTILGAAMILCHLAFGEDYTSRFISVKRCTYIMSGALMTYIALKTYSILTGANHIDSGIPLGIPGSIFSGGLIFPLNICVGMVVACTIFAIYSLFIGWKEGESEAQ